MCFLILIPEQEGAKIKTLGGDSRQARRCAGLPFGVIDGRWKVETWGRRLRSEG